MEELARETGADPALWGLAGLGAGIDGKLAAGNPERRGVMAEELLLTEGVPAEAAAAARASRAGRRARRARRAPPRAPAAAGGEARGPRRAARQRVPRAAGRRAGARGGAG